MIALAIHILVRRNNVDKNNGMYVGMDKYTEMREVKYLEVLIKLGKDVFCA